MLHENGRTEELVPRISRFARDHPVVVASPSAFEPTDREDAETTHGHRRLLERTLATFGHNDPDRHAQQA